MKDKFVKRLDRYMKFLNKCSKKEGLSYNLKEELEDTYWDLNNLKYQIIYQKLPKWWSEVYIKSYYKRCNDYLDETIKPLVEIIKLEK